MCRVCVAAVEDFKAIPRSAWEMSEAKGVIGQKEARLTELNAALRRANAAIQKYNSNLSAYDKKTNCLEAVSYVKFEQKYPVGTGVETAYGRGIVIKFRPFDGINEVHIPMYASVAPQDRKLSENGMDFTDPAAVRSFCTKDLQFHICFLRNVDLKIIQQTVHKSIFTIHYPSKNLDKLREMRVNETSFAAKNLDPFYDKDRYEDIVGALVYTTHGIGRVCSYRKSDGMYKVALKYGDLYICNNLVRISDIPPPRGVKSRSNSWDIAAAVRGVLPNPSPSIHPTLSNSNPSGASIEGKSDETIVGTIQEQFSHEMQVTVTDDVNKNNTDDNMDSSNNKDENNECGGVDDDDDDDDHNDDDDNRDDSNNDSVKSGVSRTRFDSCDANYASAATNRE